jgi:hypothetical protein
MGSTIIMLVGEPIEPTTAEIEIFVALLQSIIDREEEQLEMAS